MDNTLIYAVLAATLLVVVAVLYFANKTNGKLAALFPAGTLELIEGLLTSQGDRFLQLGLTNAATTSSELDDQFFITGLELRGYKVTGSAESGWVVTKEVTP